jgi:hypothetical protein
MKSCKQIKIKYSDDILTNVEQDSEVHRYLIENMEGWLYLPTFGGAFNACIYFVDDADAVQFTLMFTDLIFEISKNRSDVMDYQLFKKKT